MASTARRDPNRGRAVFAALLTATGITLTGHAIHNLTATTDTVAAHHQAALAATWDTPIPEPATAPVAPPQPHSTPATPHPTEPAAATPDGAVARLTAPTIGLDVYVVDGVTTGDLTRGPGRYTSTARPGADGMIAIAGHRTTYGAPFRHLDRLAVGDPVTVTPAAGGPARTYLVTGGVIVDPSDNAALTPTSDANRLVLTTCHDGDNRRLIVTAEQAP